MLEPKSITVMEISQIVTGTPLLPAGLSRKGQLWNATTTSCLLRICTRNASGRRLVICLDPTYQRKYSSSSRDRTCDWQITEKGLAAQQI